MKKVDLKKELKDLYYPAKSQVTIANIPAMNFVMFDGKGNPNTSQDYREAIETLFALSFALKFMSKKGDNSIDYTVMPLESLWWVDEMETFSLHHKDNWQWTAMIMQPQWITKDMFEQAIIDSRKKKGNLLLDKAYYKTFTEGMVAQILYIGSYQNEAPTIKAIHDVIASNGGRLVGKHHEIYLSDPRKTSADKLKTIIRQPFEQ